MKILFVSEYFPPKIMGGGEINLFLLAKSLVQSNVEVTVLTSFHSELEVSQTMQGVKVIRKLKTAKTATGIKNNITRSHTFPRSIVHELNKIGKDFDLIHFIGTSSIAAGEVKRLKVPMVATVESYPALCPKGDRIYKGKKECEIVCDFSKFISCQVKCSEIGKTKNSALIKYNPLALGYIYSFHKKLRDSLKHCSLIAISEHIKILLKKYDLESTVIPNAIDIAKFSNSNNNDNNNEAKERSDSKLKNSENENHMANKVKINILYLGSLTKFKGPQIVLEAIKGLNCHLDLYGEGILKGSLQNSIDKYNIDATIHDNVDYDKIPHLYHRADIVVFPSIWPEPFGRISIEAMAAGRPVIGSNIGGIKESIIEGTGILVEPNNVNSLKGTLKILIANHKLRNNMGAHGMKHVKVNYSQEIVLKKLISYYKNIITNND